MNTLVILFIVILIFITIYWILTKNFNYWRNRNVVYEKPQILVGNLMPLVTQKMSLGEYLRKVYEDHPDQPYVGLFLGGSPCILIRDFELARDILNKDIEHFAVRIVQFDGKREPILSKTVFALGGPRWKSARQGMTPGFTTLKLKQYFNEMIPIVNEMYQRIESNAEQDVMQLTWCWTVDAINRAMLGLQARAMLDPNDDLLLLSKQLYKTDLITRIGKFCLFAAPSFYSATRMRAFPAETVTTIKKLTWQVMGTFETSGLHVKNFMSILHNLWKGEKEKPGKEPFAYNDDGVVAQIFTILIAGTDTLSSTMTFAIYELAKRQDMQERLRQEVLQEFPDGISSMTYEKVTSLKYLHMIIMETSRLHPSFPFLDRICTKDYVLPGTDCKVDKGVFVFVAMWGMHMDERFWENPEEFNPERFVDMNEVNNKPFFPFGNGIRTCLGMRFAIHQMQLQLATLVCGWRWRLAPGSDFVRCNPLTYTNMPDRPLKIICERVN